MPQTDRWVFGPSLEDNMFCPRCNTGWNVGPERRADIVTHGRGLCPRCQVPLVAQDWNWLRHNKEAAERAKVLLQSVYDTIAKRNHSLSVITRALPTVPESVSVVPQALPTASAFAPPASAPWPSPHADEIYQCGLWSNPTPGSWDLRQTDLAESQRRLDEWLAEHMPEKLQERERARQKRERARQEVQARVDDGPGSAHGEGGSERPPCSTSDSEDVGSQEGRRGGCAERGRSGRSAGRGGAADGSPPRGSREARHHSA